MWVSAFLALCKHISQGGFPNIVYTDLVSSFEYKSSKINMNICHKKQYFAIKYCCITTMILWINRKFADCV